MGSGESQKKWNAAHPEVIRAIQQRWRANPANRARLRAIDQQYHARHPERMKARRRAYYLANREKILARNALYTATHKEAIRAREQADPSKARARIKRRRAQRHSAPINDFTAAQWATMKAHYRYCCVYCGKKPKALSQDHITPLIKGGAHTASNIVPACRRCNSKKGIGEPLVPVQPLLL